MRLSDYITSNPPEDAELEPLTLEYFEALLQDIHQALPDRPEEGQSVVMTDEEHNSLVEYGQFTRAYSDGSHVIYMTHERREELLRLLSS